MRRFLTGLFLGAWWWVFTSGVFADPANAAGIKIQNANFVVGAHQLVVKGKVDGLASAATIIVEDATSGTVLATTASSKQFGFVIKLPRDAPVPCEIRVSVEGTAALAPVRHAPPAGCGPRTITLTGLVTDGPIPFATVTVVLDGIVYTTTADANGRYSLTIATALVEQLLKIDASAVDPETGAPIDFTNLVGTFSRVLEEQEANGEAEANVTNVTTANYVLLVEANGGAPPTSLEELLAAETSIDISRLIELAAVLKLIVDDPNYSLPEGQTSLITFISDRAAVEAYLAAVDPGDFSAAINAILADSNLVAGFTADEVPDRYYEIPSANPGYLARQGSVVEFDLGTGTGLRLGTLSLFGAVPSEPFTWAIQDGRLVLDLVNPVPFISFTPVSSLNLTEAERAALSMSANPNPQVRVEIRTLRYAFTRVLNGTLVDIVSRESVTEWRVAPIELGGGIVLELENYPELRIGRGPVTMRPSTDVVTIPFVANCPGAPGTICVPGTWGAPYVYSPGARFGPIGGLWPEADNGDVLTFSEDRTVVGRISGRQATWSIGSDDALSITYDNGWTQRIRVLDSQGITYGAVVEINDGSDRYASYGPLVRGETMIALTASDLATPEDRFWVSELNEWRLGSIDADGRRAGYFGWQLDIPNSTGFLVQNVSPHDCDGDGVEDLRAQVQLVQPSIMPDGKLEIRRLFAPPSPDRIRAWYPIARAEIDGDRVLYVMELEKGLDDSILIPARMNYHREIDAPWRCRAP
jgi:hypothetical protein